MMLLLAWQAGAAAVLLLALALVIAVYISSHAFASPEVEATAKAELYETISAIIFVGLISLFITMADNFSAAFLGMDETMINASYHITSSYKADSEEIILEIQKIVSHIGKVSTQYAFCQITSIGMSMSNCGSFRTVLNILSSSAQVLATAQIQFSGLHLLISFGRDYGITYIFMLGALLRCFKISRGAGALLLAFAVSLYFLVPLLIVLTNQIITSWGLSYFQVDSNTDLVNNVKILSEKIEEVECNPFEKPDKAEEKFSKIFNDIIKSQYLDLMVYIFIFKATLTTVIVLSTITVGTRALASAFGAEIDVSALARLM